MRTHEALLLISLLLSLSPPTLAEPAPTSNKMGTRPIPILGVREAKLICAQKQLRGRALTDCVSQEMAKCQDGAGSCKAGKKAL